MIRCSSIPAPASNPRRGRSPARSPTSAAARRGGPGSTSTSGPGVAGHDEARRGADRLQHHGARAGPSPACARPPASPPRSPSRQRLRIRSTICHTRSSSAASSASARPAKAATTSAVRSSAVGPSPPLVMIRSIPCAARKSQRARRSSGRSPTTITCDSITPSPRSCSDSHGPFSSRMMPESTSVPVTTIPARTLTPRASAGRAELGSCRGRAPAGSRSRSGRRSPRRVDLPSTSIRTLSLPKLVRNRRS